MSYHVNDIFYSLQGEGRNSGRAALFVRFSGCNLKCSFCDTDFSTFREMTAVDICEALQKEVLHSNVSLPSAGQRLLCVLTGGEPSLQADAELISKLHSLGLEVAMESNGTLPPPDGIDWLTVSPKTRPAVRRCDELKCLFSGSGNIDDYGIKASYYYLQPLDTGNAGDNMRIAAECTEYIKRHPKWRLSLQTHKLVGFK